MIEVIPLFPTVIYKNDISNNITEECVNNAKQEDYIRTTPDNGWISQNQNIHKESKYADLFAALDYHVDFYCKDILKIKNDIRLECLNSWFVMNSGADFTQDHFHATSMVSGVLYLDAPEGSSPLSFHCDLYKNHGFGTFFPLEYEEMNSFNATTYHMDVDDGILVLFPSNLRHSVKPNGNDVKRYALAFNYIPTGEMSVGANKIKLSI